MTREERFASGESDRLIDARELKGLVPLHRSTVYRLERRGLFPLRRQIGERRVAWLFSEIQKWLASRAKGPGTAS